MHDADGGTITKLCVICGSDCDGQPRVKDVRGRYYHRSCHAEAAARRAEREGLGIGAGSRDASPAAPESPLIEILGGPAAASGSSGSSGPAVAPRASDPGDDWLDALPRLRPCGGCGHPLAADAALCTACGHRADGTTVRTRKQRARRGSPVGGSFLESAKEWLPYLAAPIVAGVLAVVLAVGGATTGALVGLLLVAAIGLVGLVWTLIAAWQRSVFLCLLILVGQFLLAGIPGLVFAVFFQEDRRLAGLVGGSLIGGVLASGALGILIASGSIAPLGVG